jgi:hypothetical protein
MTTNPMMMDGPGRAQLPSGVLESFWLDEIRRGYTIRTIARRDNLSERRVQSGILRAQRQELEKKTQGRNAVTVAPSAGSRPEPQVMPRLVPLFPIGPFTPDTRCGHRHPIRAGSVFCCMVCHSSGYDNHPELKRDPKTEPGLEPSQPVDATPEPSISGNGNGSVETRKQRRRRQYAAAVAVSSAAMAN